MAKQNHQVEQRAETNFAVTIALRNDRVAKLAKVNVPNVSSTAEKVGALAAGMLEDFADGAVLVDPETVSQIAAILGPDFTPQQLAAAVGASKSIRGGSTVVTWLVDPAYTEPLSETARRQGVTLDNLCQNCMDYAMSQGWIYTLDPKPKQVLFTPEQMAWLHEATGRDIMTGADIIDFINKRLADEDMPGDAEPAKV